MKATLPQLGEGLRGACGLLAGLLFSLSVGVANGQPADQLEDPALPSPLTAWNLFPLGLEWVGNTVPSDEETLELQAVLEGDYPDAADGLVGGIEAFISAWPDSAYAPSLRTQLALYYRRTCRYSLALDHWQRAWLQTSHLADGAGKSVADRTLVEWALLLANLGHHEALGDLISDAAERFLDGGLLADRWQRAVEAFQAMRNYPEAGSGCGLCALDQLAKAMGLVPSERGLLMDTPTPREGLSLLDLERLSTEHGLRLRAIRSRAGQAIPVPSIVHWNQEHYAVVLEHRRGWLAVGDPAAGGRVWITPEQLLAEATGY